MYRHLLLTLLSWCILFPTWAQNGENSFDIFNLPYSSHASSLGGNNISIIENDLSLVAQNPALLGAEMDMQLSLNYMNYISDIRYMGAQFAKALSGRSALSAGIQYLDYGSFTQTDAAGAITGNFAAKDMVMQLAYGHDITQRLRGGIHAKFLYSVYEQYRATALAVDAGINYYLAEKDLSLSLVLKNMGGSITRYHNQEPLAMPFDIQLGFSRRLSHAPFRISVTAQHLTTWKVPLLTLAEGSFTTQPNDEMVMPDGFATHLFRHLVFGVDYIPVKNFYVALGYNYKARTDMQPYGRNFISGFSLGTGIRIHMFGVGVSYAQHHVNSSSLLFNLTMRLSEF